MCPIFWISCRLSRTGNCSWSSASHCFSEVKNLSWNSLISDFCSHLQMPCKGEGMDQEKPTLDQRAQDVQGWFQVHAGEEAEVSAVYQGFLLTLLQQRVFDGRTSALVNSLFTCWILIFKSQAVTFLGLPRGLGDISCHTDGWHLALVFLCALARQQLSPAYV